METRDFVLLAYAAFDGKMRGKTMLQKRIYFLGEMLGVVDELGYIPHYYGPYSPSVANANAELAALGYLNESASSATDASGFEIVRYDYALNNAGKRIAQRKKEADPDLSAKMQQKASAIKRAGPINYVELSAAAKIYFVLRELGRKATLKAIREMAQNLGWAIPGMEMDKAVAFLEAVELVTRSKSGSGGQ